MASVATASFSGLVRNRVLLLVCPLALGLTGLNHLYYYNTLIYTMYTGVLMLLALLFYPPPPKYTVSGRRGASGAKRASSRSKAST